MLRATILALLLVLSGISHTQEMAEAPGKIYRLAILQASTPVAAWRSISPFPRFLEGLHQSGYVEGHNISITYRSAEDRLERLPMLAAELIESKPDVIFVGTCGAPLDTLRGLTRDFPIVVGSCTADIVATGIVASLAHPGGNITGLVKLNPELSAKRLEILKSLLPAVSRVAVLSDPEYSDFAVDWKILRAAANALSVKLISFEAKRPIDFEPAFAAMGRERAEALMTFTDALTYVNARLLADLATKSRLPAIYPYREIVEAGGLMSYGASLPDMWRRAAALIDKILKGAKPGDLPIEQPTKFEMVINLKTASALGITVPQSLLLRADEVIQ